MKAQIRSIAVIAIASALSLSLHARVASAQVDLSGTWAARGEQDWGTRGAGPNFADYLGMPLNAQARSAALGYTVESINEVDRQCQPWPVHYILLGPFGFRMYPTAGRNGRIVAWNISGSIDREPMTIWMDGRKPPSSQALDTPSGFTVGKWEGDTLVTTTTHIQDGYLTRNGVPSSDKESFTMYITRHGTLLTITGIVQDPVYLTAPYILSGLWVYDPNGHVSTAGNDPATCTPEEEVPSILNGRVPTYVVPSANPLLNYMTKHYGIPHQAALGGAKTMYPQYIKQISSLYRTPQNYCKVDCCGSDGPAGTGFAFEFNFDTKVLGCKEM